jgi:cytidine deaminase
MPSISQAIPQPVLDDLARKARAASAFAYCPYSNFRVGAALLCRDGSIFTGCNVENASYGLTVCAERNAVFRMAASGSTGIVALALFTSSPTPQTPCGACLQVIDEFQADNTLVVSICEGDGVQHRRLAELLPYPFRLRHPTP